MTPVARSAFVAAALLASAAGPVIAGSATSTLGVRVVVQPSCSVSGATLDFGSYTSGQAGDLGGFTQIAYSHCAPGQLRFQLDGGSSGSTTARKLGNGSGGQLNYGIFRDSARAQNFGQGTDARLLTVDVSGSGNVSVYGKIPGGQVAAAGTYTDTVVITMDAVRGEG